ncbi:sorting nexin 3 [Purpureocillium lavendulum]|uniref:Sorting nexin 3 n=1 Tax=Purpureocillium lavendulum TaxID=1247861 RepID=A0AB34FTV2_9HYPO|nr:sorting nexin 3 [Purpureocillium lavendulum]
MPTLNGNSLTLSQLINAIGRCTYHLLTYTTTTEGMIDYGNDMLCWYRNPMVTGDIDGLFQLDTAYGIWRDLIPTDVDDETRITFDCLRSQIEEESNKLQHI